MKITIHNMPGKGKAGVLVLSCNECMDGDACYQIVPGDGSKPDCCCPFGKGIDVWHRVSGRTDCRPEVFEVET